MLQFRRAGRRVFARVSSRFTIGSLTISLAISAGLLAGCGEAIEPLAKRDGDQQLSVTWKPEQARVTTTGINPLPQPTIRNVATSEHEGPYWSFPTEADQYFADSYPVLIPLPEVEDSTAENVVNSPAVMLPAFADQDTTQQDTEEPLVARLLPPRPIEVISVPENLPEPTFALPPIDDVKLEAVEVTPQPSSSFSSNLPVIAELNEQQRMMNQLLEDSSSAATGVLTDHRINELAKTKIRSSYAMANRGSLYVAQQELVEVLRMISQAGDAASGTSDRSTALAAGLRALREAEDFVPRGTQLEGELDISVLCASHRTPVAKQARQGTVLPRIMMDRYLRYAQLQLSMSVAGEPAGSMALHALGKLHSHLGHAEPEKHRLADRHAIAFQQAALLAHNQNHLAAHELGVLLAKSGHFAEAQQLLSQVAGRAPNAVVFRNLARVQEELGQSRQAVASREHAHQLTQQGATGTNTVNWVPPTQFAQSSVRNPRPQQAPHMIAQRQPSGQLPIPGSRQPMTQTIRR